MGEVAWACPPALALTQEPWGPLAPGTMPGSSHRGQSLGGPEAMSHCTSLLSHELITQVPGCAPEAAPSHFPVSPTALATARSPKPAADKPEPVYGDGNQSPDPSGPQVTRHVSNSTRTRPAELAGPQHAGWQARPRQAGMGQEEACLEEAVLSPRSTPAAGRDLGSEWRGSQGSKEPLGAVLSEGTPAPASWGPRPRVSRAVGRRGVGPAIPGNVMHT